VSPAGFLILADPRKHSKMRENRFARLRVFSWEENFVKITGSYTIDAPRDEVWEALNDIEVLARIVPGCSRLEQTGENEFEGTVKIGIQAIKGTYNGRIRLEDIQPPHHYRLVAGGRSSDGAFDGPGTIDLSEEDGKTILQYIGLTPSIF
jgi:carbon monoxide dehydrogenase subunit G